MNTMNSKRLNLIGAVRAGLEAAGYSTVKVVNAVNSALGQLQETGSESKLGDGKAGKGTYKVSESTVTKYAGEINEPLRFDAWHSAVTKANKIAEMDSVAIPAVFGPWLQKMKVDIAPAPVASVAASAPLVAAK